jgi:hypothetical protein
VTKGDEPEVANDGSTAKESDEVAVAPHPSCCVEEPHLKENPVQESAQRFKAVKVTDFVLFALSCRFALNLAVRKFLRVFLTYFFLTRIWSYRYLDDLLIGLIICES